MSTSISFTHPVGTMYPGYVTRALMPYLIGRLGADGVTASLVVEPGDSSMFLVIKDLFRYNLSPLFVQLLEAPPISHKEILNRWADGVCNRIRIEAAQLANPNVLRQRVRTELVPSHTTQHPDFSYARPFPGGLALGLCLDFPNTVTTITDRHLAKYPIGLDELYHYGQINTDGEPIDEQGPCGPFTGIGGESLFIASKAAHVANLVATLRIDAPHGLFFAIPDRSILLYAPADPTSITQQYLRLLDYLRIDFMRRFRANPAHTLSKDLFYCGPDGEFGTITRSDHPDVQELFTTVNLDADRLVELAVKNMNFFDGFRSRFYPTNM